MYYQNYEDYMRSILGYPINPNTYQMNCYDENIDNLYLQNSQDKTNLEEMYPDIFKALRPAIEDVCARCNTEITKDRLEEMVDEVYSKIERNEINISINVVNGNEIINDDLKEENRSCTQNTMLYDNIRNNCNKTNLQKNILEREIRESSKKADRQYRPNRRPNSNQFIRDLIKILIINRLTNNRPPIMTPRPNYPPRPPSYLDLRPPIMPSNPRDETDFNNYLRF